MVSSCKIYGKVFNLEKDMRWHIKSINEGIRFECDGVPYMCCSYRGGSGHEPLLFKKNAPTVQRLTQPLAAKSKLYVPAVGLFALTEINERRISGA